QEFLPFTILRQSMVEQRGPWSTHLVLVMPLLFAASWPPPWGARRGPVFHAIAFALLIAAAWETGNRMMWIAFGVQLAVAIAFTPLTPPAYPQLRHAHNVFIDVGIELGAVGLAIFIAMLAMLAIAYGRIAANAATAPLGVLGLAILTGFVVKNLTDDFMHRHNALVFWALNGMLLGLARAR